MTWVLFVKPITTAVFSVPTASDDIHFSVCRFARFFHKNKIFEGLKNLKSDEHDRIIKETALCHSVDVNGY